jgi:L-asparaginase II
VALGADGTVALQAGDPSLPVFPRSANKPLQAAAMLRCGLGLDGRLLALAAASHSGEDFHLAGVREILAGADLTEDALLCPPALPLSTGARAALLRAGGDASRITMNCSGKHAAMAATCVRAGWPVGSYLQPGHPLQLAIRRTVERLAAERVSAVGVDGCGAPLFALSLTGVARAMRALVLAAPGSPERMVADAMRAYPEWTSGPDRPERALMDAVPGLLLKAGAEGVEAFAMPDGRAAAYKVEDGAARVRPALTVARLRTLGVGGPDGRRAGAGLPAAGGRRPPGAAAAGAPVDGPPVDGALVDGALVDGALVDVDALERIGHVPVLGGGSQVGEIRITLPG